MKAAEQESGIVKVETQKVQGHSATSFTDSLSVEEPLEICITADFGSERLTQVVAVTMRTPGDDQDLALGFLFTEGIISARAEIMEIINEKCNVINVVIAPGIEIDPQIFQRHSFMASSCGVCGKKSIDSVRVKRNYQTIENQPLLRAEVIHSLPEKLRSVQAAFASTGGIHASALFDNEGEIAVVREDVGRHNALDKVIGKQFMAEAMPLNQSVLLVSGRTSFELVQKAAHAGIPVLAAVGAPSSLAVQLAEECSMTLLGFVRDNRFNVYAGGERLVGLK